jgi:hypothetical protein
MSAFRKYSTSSVLQMWWLPCPCASTRLLGRPFPEFQPANDSEYCLRALSLEVLEFYL